MAEKKWFNRNVKAMGLTSYFSDASHEMVTAILPMFITVVLGAPAIALGIIEGVAEAMASGVKLFSGYYSDRVARRKPFGIVGYGLTGLVVPIFAFATSWVHILGLKSLVWMGRGLREPPRDALLAASVEEKDLGKAFGVRHSLDTLGAVTGPALALLLISYVGMREIFLLALIPGVLSVIAFMAVREEKALPQKRDLRFFESLEGLPREFRMFLLAIGLFSLGNFAKTFLILRAETILEPSLGVMEASAAAISLYLFYNLVRAVGESAAGWLGDLKGRKNILAAGYIIFGAASLLFIFPSQDMVYMGMVFGLAGLSQAIVKPMEGAITGELLKESKGTGYGMLHTIKGLGLLVSSSVFGGIWTFVSPEAAFIYGGVFAGLGFISLMLWFKD